MLKYQPSTIVLLASLLFIWEKPAASQESQPSTSQEEDKSDDSIDTVIVIGERPGRMEDIGGGALAGSYDAIAREELEYEHPNDTLELFNKTPGVTLSRYNQGIINTDISIRGFAGDGVTPHAKLLIDGIPTNLHNGYNELDQMFPMAIGGIEVFKGTSDVRYGLYNIAGNYQISSRSDESIELQATYGSFDTFELQSYVGHSFDRLTQNLFVGYRQTSGYRDHNDLKKYAVSGRWFYEFSDKGSLGFIARLSGYEGDSPGYLPRNVVRQNPRSSADFANQDGGDKSTEHYSIHFDHLFLDDTIHVSAKGYLQNVERERWVRFSEASSLQNRFDDQQQTGFLTKAEWTPHPTWQLSAGFDYEGQENIEQRFGAVGQSRTRDTSNVIRNFDFSFNVVGGFFKIQHTIFERIRWNAGVRFDSLDGNFTSFDAEGQETNGDIFAFGVIAQPKANLFIEVVNGLTLFGNYGRSFQHPFGRALFTTTGGREARQVSINDGWEAGLRWSGLKGLDIRASYWQQLARNEFVSIDGVNRNVGETNRTGFEIAANWYPLSNLYFWGNFSRTFTEITNPGEDAQGTIGNRLRSVPDFTTSFGARYDMTSNIFARVHVDGQGNYYVNEQNFGGRFGEYILASADFGFQTDTDRISIQVNNIFDQFFEYVFDLGFDGTNTIHSPGAGRNASISYTRKF